MADTVTKIDPNTIQVAKSVTTDTVASYEVGFLKRQRIAIQAQKDRDNAARDAELAEVDALLAEADKLGVVEKLGNGLTVKATEPIQ